MGIWRQWSHWKESSKGQQIGVLGKGTVDWIGLECLILRGHHDNRLINQHGLLEAIVSDWGLKIVSKLWQYLMGKLGIRLRLSTLFHPQTDRQTEQVNQVLKQHLQIFTLYNQDNWSWLLGQASFSNNNLLHLAIKVTPFYANFGYHPQWTDKLHPTDMLEVPSGKYITADIITVHKQCLEGIVNANLDYATYYNKGRVPHPIYKVSNKVLLSSRNNKTNRPMKKLIIWSSGPHKITKLIGSHACRLGLPKTMKTHNIFRVSLLQPYVLPTYPNQQVEPPGPIKVVGFEEYEVSKVVDSKIQAEREIGLLSQAARLWEYRGPSIVGAKEERSGVGTGDDGQVSPRLSR